MNKEREIMNAEFKELVARLDPRHIDRRETIEELEKRGYCVDIDCRSCDLPSGLWESEKTYKELLYKELISKKLIK